MNVLEKLDFCLKQITTRNQFQALKIDYCKILVPVLQKLRNITFNQLIIDYSLSFWNKI